VYQLLIKSNKCANRQGAKRGKPGEETGKKGRFGSFLIQNVIEKEWGDEFGDYTLNI